MTDQLGCKVIARCISAAVHIAVKIEYLNRICSLDLGLYLRDLCLHTVYHFICLILYLENSSEVVEVLIYILHITAKLVALDRRQGHNSIAA